MEQMMEGPNVTPKRLFSLFCLCFCFEVILFCVEVYEKGDRFALC